MCASERNHKPVRQLPPRTRVLNCRDSRGGIGQIVRSSRCPTSGHLDYYVAVPHDRLGSTVQLWSAANTVAV